MEGLATTGPVPTSQLTRQLSASKHPNGSMTLCCKRPNDGTKATYSVDGSKSGRWLRLRRSGTIYACKVNHELLTDTEDPGT